MAKRILIWLVVATFAGLLLIPAEPAAAANELPDDGVIIWNEDYTLAEGEELTGGLVVFNGDVALETGSRISGDAVVWNGSVDANGVIEGNLVTTNGDIQLGEDAYVQGDVICSWNCNITQAEDARVDGNIDEGPSLRGLPFGEWGEPGLRIHIPSPEEEPPWVSGPRHLLRWVVQVTRSVVTILVITAIGGLVTLIWPKATAEVERTILEAPGTSLGVGFLTLIAAVTLAIALTLTCCFSPFAAIVLLALGAAGLFGWSAIGAWVGRRLIDALNTGEVAPLWTAALGTGIITLVTVGLTSALCLAPLGWLLLLVIGCFGLGAVVLSRFGTTPYVPGRRAPADTPPPPPAFPEQPPADAPLEEVSTTIEERENR